MLVTEELRPIAPDDAERLRRFHTRLSSETIYRRYHAPHPVLDERELEYLVSADGTHHLAWVACDGAGEIMAVCRLIESAPHEGEIAIVVADDAQGHGLGHQLLARVLEEARRRGFRRLDALILATNMRARRLFMTVADELGIPWIVAVSDGVAELELRLPPAEARG